MSDATVFSRVQQIDFDRPVATFEAQRLLKGFLVRIGEPLSYHGVILGHIKMLAKMAGENDFLFLSLTRLDEVDVKPSPNWASADAVPIPSLELILNVLVFGYSREAVAKAVAAAAEQLAAVGRVKVKTARPAFKLHGMKRKIKSDEK